MMVYMFRKSANTKATIRNRFAVPGKKLQIGVQSAGPHADCQVLFSVCQPNESYQLFSSAINRLQNRIICCNDDRFYELYIFLTPFKKNPGDRGYAAKRKSISCMHYLIK